jgi:hypothetical protein
MLNEDGLGVTMAFLKNNGQSVAEYTVTACLVGIASLGALSFMSDSFSSSLSKMTSSVVPATGAAQELTASAGTPATGGTGSLPVAGAGGGSITVDLGNGKSVTLPSFISNTKALYETAGSSGVTSALAAEIQQFAQALFDAGEISQTELDGLVALANQGHRIGSVIEVLENVPPVADGYSTMVNFEGQSYLLNDLGQTIGLNVTFDHTGTVTAYQLDLAGNVATTGGESQKFLDLYKALQDQPAFANAQVKNLVTALSQQILEIADTHESNIAGVAYAKSTGNKVTDNYLQDGNFLMRLNDSALVHGDSVVLCATGNGNSAGNSCS